MGDAICDLCPVPRVSESPIRESTPRPWVREHEEHAHFWGWRVLALCVGVATTLRGGDAGSALGARRPAGHKPAPPALAAPTRRLESSAHHSRRRLPEGISGGYGVRQLSRSTAALCQRPRPPPVKAARSPKTRPRVRSAPTLEPSNDERLPPSAFANSSSCTAKSARATTKRWPSSQQLEPRAPRPSRGAVGCPPAPSTSY